jgi:hypothetical protein
MARRTDSGQRAAEAAVARAYQAYAMHAYEVYVVHGASVTRRTG